MEGSFENQATEYHKGERIMSYTLKFKLKAVIYAKLHGNRSAGRKFNVYIWRIHALRKKKEQISKHSKKLSGKERKTLEGTGWKPAHEFVKGKVLARIYDCHKETSEFLAYSS